MPARVERRTPPGSVVNERSEVHCSGVGLTQYWSLQGAIGPVFLNQSSPFATSAGSGDLVGGVTGLPSLSNCRTTPSIRSLWLWTNAADWAGGSVAVISGVVVIRCNSRLAVPSGGKAQSKFRLLLALAGLDEVQGVARMGPFVDASVAMVVAPCLIVRVPSTEIGEKSGRWNTRRWRKRLPSM